MSSVAALNQPQRCTQELNEFDWAMGWAFRDLTLHDDHPDNDDLDRILRERKHREHTLTALDARFEIPNDFVAPKLQGKSPTASSSKTNKRSVHSAAYSKRSVESSASQGPNAGPSRPATATPHHQRRRQSRSGSPVREPHVDFVYDIQMRRQLRARMDAERLEARHQATTREQKLRAEHKWVDDGGGGPQARRPGGQSLTTYFELKRPKMPVVSAKTAVAPNVSEWRTQETAFHPSKEAQRAQRRRVESHRRRLQQREATKCTRRLPHSRIHGGPGTNHANNV